jgi:uncharacterized protein (DUF1501 family)
MPDKTAFTRREFLHTGVGVVSTVATIPTFLQNAAVVMAAPRDGAQVASLPGVPDDRVLVVIQLSGGNDGLNTVVPYGMREYHNARPRLAIGDNDALKLDTTQGIGLNPQMADFKALVDDGLGAIMQGVGYPNPNRSHFASMDVWHTGDTLTNRGTGWIGRALDQYRRDRDNRIDACACVAVGNESPLAANGADVSAVSFQNANLYRWAGGDLNDKLARQYDALSRDTASGDSQVSFVQRTALDAQVSSDQIRQAVARGSLTQFPGGNTLANDLRMVAQMIRAELPTRVYYVALGGFDTHANQTFQHGRLLQQFSSAVRAFYNELDAIGQRQRVLTMAFSEFGRRVAQNASNGTDHGCAGPMFLVGDMVKPGLLGTHPSLANLDNGDLIYNTDFRTVYAAVLDQWMKIDSTVALGKTFNPAPVLNVPA